MNSMSRRCALEFKHCAGNVVIVGDDDNPLVMVCIGPFDALGRIAHRIQRRPVDIDTAFEQRGVAAGDTLQLASVGGGMDAADEKPLATLVLEKFKRPFDAGIAAGEHDDAVRGLRSGPGVSQCADVIAEDDEAADKQAQ